MITCVFFYKYYFCTNFLSGARYDCSPAFYCVTFCTSLCVWVFVFVCVCGCMYEYVRSVRTLAEAQTTIIIYQEPLHIAGNYFDIRTVRTRAQQYIYIYNKKPARTRALIRSSSAATAASQFLCSLFVYTHFLHIYPYMACATRPGMSESDTDFVVCKVRSLANLSLLMSVWCVCV